MKAKKWLIANAVFSTISGLVLIIDNSPMQELFGFSNDFVFPVLGVGLLIFAGMVFRVAIKKSGDRKEVQSISFADFGWVAGSIVLIAFRPFELTTTGYIVIAAVALVVALFGIQQYRSVAGK